jgi:hypothetical protein
VPQLQDFCFALDNGHTATIAPCPFRAIFRHHVVSFDHPVGEGHADEKLKTKPDAAEITLDLGDFG